MPNATHLARHSDGWRTLYSMSCPRRFEAGCKGSFTAPRIARVIAARFHGEASHGRSIRPVHANGSERVSVAPAHHHTFIHRQRIIVVPLGLGISASCDSGTRGQNKNWQTLHTRSCLIAPMTESPVAYTVGTKSNPHPSRHPPGRFSRQTPRLFHLGVA